MKEFNPLDTNIQKSKIKCYCSDIEESLILYYDDFVWRNHFTDNEICTDNITHYIELN